MKTVLSGAERKWFTPSEYFPLFVLPIALTSFDVILYIKNSALCACERTLLSLPKRT